MDTKEFNFYESMNAIFNNMAKLADNAKIISASVNKIMEPLSKIVENYKKSLEPINRMLDSFYKCYDTTILPNINSLAESFKSMNLDKFVNLFASVQTYAKENDLPQIDNQDYKEFSKELVMIPQEIANTNLSTRKKKNLFLRFIELLLKCIAGNALTLILFFCQPYYDNLFVETPQQTLIYESLEEIKQIQEEENIQNELRVIKHKTYIYNSINLTSIIAKVEIGDIMIVLENDKPILKVQDYQTGVVGYIRKKYTIKS